MSFFQESLILPLLHQMSSCSLWVSLLPPKVAQEGSKTSVELGESYVEKVGKECMQGEGFLQESAEVLK